MKSLIPYTEQAITHSVAKQFYLFLLSSTHGQAKLGFVLNGYGFIHPYKFKQSELTGTLAAELYKKYLLNLHDGVSQYNSDNHLATGNVLWGLSNFQLVFAQSIKPLNKNELKAKQHETLVSKFNASYGALQRFYTCKVDFQRKQDLEDIAYLAEIGKISYKEFIKIIKDNALKEFRKRFKPSSLNAFESLEFLVQFVYGGIEFYPDYSHTNVHYGAVMAYKDKKIPRKLN